jgi:hypothetical protein
VIQFMTGIIFLTVHYIDSSKVKDIMPDISSDIGRRESMEMTIKKREQDVF